MEQWITLKDAFEGIETLLLISGPLRLGAIHAHAAKHGCSQHAIRFVHALVDAGRLKNDNDWYSLTEWNRAAILAEAALCHQCGRVHTPPACETAR